MLPRPKLACTHKFALGDSRSGPIAAGACVYCGAQGAFPNTLGGALLKGASMRQAIHNAMVREGRVLRGAIGAEGLDLAQAAENFKKGHDANTGLPTPNLHDSY